eukprot:scaffold26895_cov34-Phaeocystis_antarctica.AAC.1
MHTHSELRRCSFRPLASAAGGKHARGYRRHRAAALRLRLRLRLRLLPATAATSAAAPAAVAAAALPGYPSQPLPGGGRLASTARCAGTLQHARWPRRRLCPRTCRRSAEPSRPASGVHAACVRAVHAVHTRCACGAHAVHTRCTRGAHAVWDVLGHLLGVCLGLDGQRQRHRRLCRRAARGPEAVAGR